MTMRNHFFFLLTAFFLVAVGSGFGQAGQAAPGKLSFDVATVRPSAPLDMAKMAADMQAGKMPRFGPHVDASRAEFTYMSLKELIAFAYKVKTYQVTGPDWLGSDRFDIGATMAEGASKDDAPAMLQTLLEDRFKLAIHRDTQEHPVLALVVGKGGPKLKESPAPTAPIADDAPLKPGEMKMEGPDGPIRMTRNADGSTTMNMGAKGTVTQRMDMTTQSLEMDSSMVTMAGFADMLTTVMQMGGGGGRQVVDMTGLKGNYQVSLVISLADLIATARAQGMAGGASAGNGGGTNAAPASAASDPSGGSSTVFASVEKLGLKLESRKAPVEQLVVDHMEKTPSDN
jgi:uncharacterized protein (TIGR03435 family)